MCDKCCDCVHCKYIPATYEDPSEYWCKLDMDEFYEEDADCPKFKEQPDYWDKYAYEEDRYDWRENDNPFLKVF